MSLTYNEKTKRYTHSNPYINKVIETESSNRQFDVSGNVIKNKKTGALGLMQVLPSTASQPGFGVKSINSKDLLNPQKNVSFGIKYLKGLEKYYNDKGYKNSKALSLIAYNFGPGNANKYLKGEKTLPEETVNYVKNILGVDVKKNLDSDSKLAKESVDEKVSKMGAAEIRKANRKKLMKRKTGGMVYRNYYSYEPKDI